jgi:hypothetical protein
MVKGQDWREEVYRQFSFLYTHGYTMTGASVDDKGAIALFSSKTREIVIRKDNANRVYVQIYKTGPLWSWLLQPAKGVNVFELARRFPSAGEIPVRTTETDFSSIFRENAEFMQTHLADIIDGKSWVDSMDREGKR